MMRNQYRWTIGLMILALSGVGCVSSPVSTQNPEEAAQSLTLEAGSEIVVRETVFGLGGAFVKFFKKEDAHRRLLLNSWNSSTSAQATWTRTLQTETEASKLAREAYEAEFANAPIGTSVPETPELQYETTVESGELTTQSLADATKVFLPIFWVDGEQAGDGSSLIWLSQKQYDELVQTRTTQVNLGLFDDSVSYAVGLTDQVKNFVDRIRGSEALPDETSLLDIQADIDWTTYSMIVDGEPTEVRAIQAQNAFARYVILANRDNPIILELKLSPASRGSLHLFSRAALGDAFWGYEVVSITRADALANVHPPQP